jgi:hypothetical protein
MGREIVPFIHTKVKAVVVDLDVTTSIDPDKSTTDVNGEFVFSHFYV